MSHKRSSRSLSAVPPSAVSAATPGATGVQAAAVDPVVQLLDRVQQALDAGQPAQALELLKRLSTLNDSRLVNARCVALMRMNAADTAVRLLRAMVTTSGGLVWRTDVPVEYMTNLATAMLLAGNPTGCADLLRALHQEQHPSVQRVRGALRAWRAQLTAWERFAWRTWGRTPAKPPVVDIPPGELVR